MVGTGTVTVTEQKRFIHCIIYTLILTKKVNSNDIYSINAANCGQRPLVSNQTVSKIVGGVQALNGDWPWQIIMFYNGGFTCGGSIINSLWVVTAG